MKKKLYLLVVGALMVFTLCACSVTKTNTMPEKTNDQETTADMNTEIVNMDTEAIDTAIETESTELMTPVVDLDGTYTCDTMQVIITGSTEGKYVLNITVGEAGSIKEATGTLREDSLEFTGKDPDGNTISGLFYQNGDNNYEVLVTESSWSEAPVDQKFLSLTKEK